MNSVYVYDPQADAWTQLASMGVARRRHASAAVGGKLYVFGGIGGEDEYLSTAEVYDPASDSWAQESKLQPFRGGRSLSAETAGARSELDRQRGELEASLGTLASPNLRGVLGRRE